MKCDTQREYDEVRRVYFPRWDRNNDWFCEIVGDLDGAQGCCDTGQKCIRLLSGHSGDRLRVLLIHEIAHAVASGGHGKKWQARMEQAARTAETLGRAEVAALLRKDVAAYNDPLAEVTAAGVYSQIEDAVVGNPDVTFWQVIDSVRRDYGLARKGFLRRFCRARAVFDQEKRDAVERSRARAKWITAILVRRKEVFHEGPDRFSNGTLKLFRGPQRMAVECGHTDRKE